MSTLLIKNGRIINAGEETYADVYIERGKISAIFEKIDSPAEHVLDVSGKYVIPGGIDAHTHLELPLASFISRDDFETGTQAAACGGTTTIIDFVTPAGNESLQSALDSRRQSAEGKSCVDYGFHMVVSDSRQAGRESLEAMLEEGISSFKMFMAYPQTLMLSDGDIFQIMQTAGQLGAMITIHAENGAVIERLVGSELEKGNNAPVYHALTRPSVLEGEAVNRAIALAELSGVNLYIVHLSSMEGLEHVRRSRQKGLAVFAETCPQYLLCSIEDMINDRQADSAKYVYSPPPREKQHQTALWKGLKDRSIQTIATDHCPFNLHGEKYRPGKDFSQIPNGAPGIENRLQLIYEWGVNQNRLDLKRWVELCSTAPAHIFGLYPRKGIVATGSDADIVIWDPQAESVISAGTHHMNVDYNLYEGLKIRGNVDTVISRGEIIVQNNRFHGSKGRGVYLKRTCFKGELL
jgi:dihydropyrimidinase